MTAELFIIGIGPGSPDYILPAARNKLNQADTIIGARRVLQSVKSVISEGKKFLPLNDFNDLIDYLNKNNSSENIVIAVSGDTGFYSLLDYISSHIKTDFNVVPGISSLQYFYAKLKRNYKDVSWVSLHGQDCSYLNLVKEGKEVFLLLDHKHSPSLIARELLTAGVTGVSIYVGENLSYPEERITKMSLDEAVCYQAADLCVVVIK